MEDNIEPGWRKSSFSGNGGGDCVEAGTAPGRVMVRDTVDRDGAVIEFSAASWRAFAAAIKSDNAA